MLDPLFGLQLKECFRRHFELQMNSFFVVVVDLQMNRFNEVFNGCETMNIPKFLFESSVERFLPSILPWTGFGTLRWKDFVLEQPFFARNAGVFTALVRMEQKRRTTPFLGIFKGLNDERCAVVESNAPPNHFSREEVNDGR